MFFVKNICFCCHDLLSHLDGLVTFSKFTKRVIAQYITTVTVV